MNYNEWLENLWQKTKSKLEKTAVSCRDIIPYTADENGTFIDYYKISPNWWTNGFWG